MPSLLNVVIIKPSKYMPDGTVERFRRGFMPNSTVPHVRSMVPPELDQVPLQTFAIDEYVYSDLQYLKLLEPARGTHTLVVLVGVQSHQFHRALDLAAFARKNGCMVVIGGPHVMTCDTSMLQGNGVSFAQCEAELVWTDILQDALAGELRPLYGAGLRWQEKLESPVLIPPNPLGVSQIYCSHVGCIPSSRLSFSLQLLFRNDDRRTEDSQSKYLDHNG